MSLTAIDNRFFSTTRGQVLLALRRGPRTVEELARALDLSRNTVRSHLVRLERDELVQSARTRRGIGKPAGLYELTAVAEQLFSQAYAPVLRQLLDVLREQLPADEVLDLLREVGQRIALEQGLDGDRGNPHERLAQAEILLEQLGGRGATDDRGPVPRQVHARESEHDA
jgi:predicted ArsR family transcriptional regulator